MTRLTAIRLAKVTHILDAAYDSLVESGDFYAPWFERDMDAVLNVGTKDMQDIAEDLLKYPKYQPVSVYYMENVRFPICFAFKNCLAKVFGIDDYDRNDGEKASKKYWEAKFQEIRGS